ncbi:MAG: hypothetical protein ACLP3R_13180 [Candidatus Korobacteraceae bacterium]
MTYRVELANRAVRDLEILYVYRVIYEVDERRQTVWVLTIRHGARRKLTPSDLA